MTTTLKMMLMVLSAVTVEAPELVTVPKSNLA